MPSNPAPLHPLGKNGPLVPALGFGLMGLSYNTYGSVPSDEERFKILDRAYELGNRFWDTADLYGDGEELLGKWFRRTGKREEIFLASKFGFLPGTYGVDSSAKYCKEACAKSLERLGVETIDLYYMHHANPKTPIEETVRALAELKEEGKIKYIGLSGITSTTLRRAFKIAPITAVQVDYSPLAIEIENSSGTNLLATCREFSVAIVAAMPLGRGMLTSTFASGESLGDSADKREIMMPRFQEANKENNAKVVGKFGALAEKKGCTAPQLALAWLLKQGADVFPIPGTKRMKYMEENWRALDVVLTGAEELEVRAFAETGEISGSTLPPQFEGYNFIDTAEEEI